MAMPTIRRALTAALVLLVALTLGLIGFPPARANNVARTTPIPGYPTDFHPGLLISDDAFHDTEALTRGEIKEFVKEKGKGCTTKNGATCLKDLVPAKTVTLKSNDDDAGCEDVTFTKGNRAWTVIEKVAKACGISPKVLLVTIQKEQSGLTLARPAKVWNKMMGMGCPDGGSCVAKYSGYEKQLYYGADRLRAFRTWSTYPAIKAFNRGSTYTSLDGHAFVIHNVATASLLQYTPWVRSNYSFFSLMRNYFPGTANTLAPELAMTTEPGDLPKLTVTKPASTPIRQSISVKGTAKNFPGGATIETQIKVDGKWKTSKTKKKVKGAYSIPLTTNASKAGTQSWRVVARSADGRSSVVPKTFTLKRLKPSLTATAPKSAKVKAKVSVKGSAKNFPDGATVKTQIKVDGKWKTSKTVTKVTGSYSIPLTARASVKGTQSWRVVATSKDGTSKLTKTFTLRRT